MRRSDREMTAPEDLLKVLEEGEVCHLALNDGEEGYPYMLPVNYGFSVDGDGTVTLYFHGAMQGHKYDIVERDPRASFEIDCGRKLIFDDSRGYCTMDFRSVIGRGRIEFIEDRDAKIRALTAIVDKYHPKEHFEYSKAAVDRTRVMKLTVESMIGKNKATKPVQPGAGK